MRTHRANSPILVARHKKAAKAKYISNVEQCLLQSKPWRDVCAKTRKRMSSSSHLRFYLFRPCSQGGNVAKPFELFRQLHCVQALKMCPGWDGNSSKYVSCFVLAASLQFTEQSSIFSTLWPVVNLGVLCASLARLGAQAIPGNSWGLESFLDALCVDISGLAWRSTEWVQKPAGPACERDWGGHAAGEGLHIHVACPGILTGIAME